MKMPYEGKKLHNNVSLPENNVKIIGVAILDSKAWKICKTIISRPLSQYVCHT